MGFNFGFSPPFFFNSFSLESLKRTSESGILTGRFYAVVLHWSSRPSVDFLGEEGVGGECSVEYHPSDISAFIESIKQENSYYSHRGGWKISALSLDLVTEKIDSLRDTHVLQLITAGNSTDSLCFCGYHFD